MSCTQLGAEGKASTTDYTDFPARADARNRTRKKRTDQQETGNRKPKMINGVVSGSRGRWRNPLRCQIGHFRFPVSRFLLTSSSGSLAGRRVCSARRGGVATRRLGGRLALPVGAPARRGRAENLRPVRRFGTFVTTDRDRLSVRHACQVSSPISAIRGIRGVLLGGGRDVETWRPPSHRNRL